MVNQPTGLKGFWKRCTEASRNSAGTAWLALAAAFFALGISGSSAAYIALGVAFLAIAVGAMKRKRTHASPE